MSYGAPECDHSAEGVTAQPAMLFVLHTRYRLSFFRFSFDVTNVSDCDKVSEMSPTQSAFVFMANASHN